MELCDFCCSALPCRHDLNPVYRAALATCQPTSIPFQRELLFSIVSSASSPLCSLVSTIETDAGRPIQEFRPSSAAARIEQSGPAQSPRFLVSSTKTLQSSSDRSLSANPSPRPQIATTRTRRDEAGRATSQPAEISQIKLNHCLQRQIRPPSIGTRWSI